MIDEWYTLPGVQSDLYYYRLESIDGMTETGVFSAFWEERP